MSIDVGCGREGAVSEPDLNLFHGDSFAEKQAGTSMPKIMEADLLEVVLLNHPCEVFCHIIGSEELAGLTDTDVVEVTIRCAAARLLIPDHQEAPVSRRPNWGFTICGFCIEPGDNYCNSWIISL